MQERPRYQTAGKAHSFMLEEHIVVSNMESWDVPSILVTTQGYESSGTEEEDPVDGISLTWIQSEGYIQCGFDLSKVPKVLFEYIEESPLSKFYYKIE